MWLEIAGRAVGTHTRVFSIAEIGLNHGGDLAQALRMVDAAAHAGAAAIKLQTLYADTLVAASCPAPAHVAAASLREFFATFELDLHSHRAVFARARQHRLAVMSTPFSEESVAMLDGLGIDAFKIASGDLTNDGLIAAAARTGKPLVISTGMATLDEVIRAVRVARGAGADQIALLHCVSAYPVPAGAENLRAIQTLADALHLPVGLSDHTADGLVAAVAGVALGGSIYERHFMLEGDAPIDEPVSSTPAQFQAIVNAMEQTRLALGDGRKRCLPAEAPNVIPSRRGLYARRRLRAGDRITAADVIALRPANGVSPADLPQLVGTVVARHIEAGAAFEACDLAVEMAV